MSEEGTDIIYIISRFEYIYYYPFVYRDEKTTMSEKGTDIIYII